MINQMRTHQDLTTQAVLQVAAGSTSSFCCMVGGQLCAWGKLKVSGDNTMYPKPFTDLAGWSIRHMACGAQTYVCSAFYGKEEAVVSWCVLLLFFCILAEAAPVVSRVKEQGADRMSGRVRGSMEDLCSLHY